MKIIKPSFKFFPSSMNIYQKVETCGRTCYQSFDKISNNSYEKFIKMILSRKHYAVLEHGMIILKVHSFVWTFLINYTEESERKYIVVSEKPDGYIISGNVRAWIELIEKVKERDSQGDLYPTLIQALKSTHNLFFENFDTNIAFRPDVAKVLDPSQLSEDDFILHFRPTVKIIADRGFLAEITRHREASFSVESTRYCSYDKDKFGNEITVIKPFFYDDSIKHKIMEFFHIRKSNYTIWEKSCKSAEKAYFSLLKGKSSPQEARTILPNSLKTEIMMTANIKEWNKIFELRCAEAAHPQMREIMIPLRESFNLLLLKKFTI